MVIGYVGGNLIRAVVWFWHLLGVHPHGVSARAPVPKPTPRVSPTPMKPSKHLVAVGRALGAAVLVAGVLLVAAMAVMAGVRRYRRPPAEATVEERQSLVNVGDAVRAAGGRARNALRRLVHRRETGPQAPAQALRREYRLLERALERGGRLRPPGTTARVFLAGLSPATAETAAILAGLYDRARYSQKGVSVQDVAHFRGLAPAILEQLGPPAH